MTSRPSPETPAESDSAVSQLMEEHGGQIYRLGLRLCGNPQDAEDLVQEVFLQAFRGWNDFEGRSSPKTWLYTIASRVCQRMHRPRAGEPAHMESLDALLPFGERRIAGVVDDYSEVVREQIRTEARETVEAAIGELPADFRVPLILKEVVGFTVPEVATILGLEEGTVKSRVHRARLRLRAAIDPVIPRQGEDAPPAAYSRQVCLDLLNAKQEALDRGVPFNDEIICDRCRSVFASLDLTQSVCRDLARGTLPEGLRERVLAAVADGSRASSPSAANPERHGE